MNKDEVARKLTKVNQLMNELIYALMQTGMKAGRGRSLRDAKQKETLEGNGKRLRKRFTRFADPPVSQKCHEFVTFTQFSVPLLGRQTLA